MKSTVTKILFLTFFATSSAFGGDSSGGGGIFSEDSNPWFVKNTTLVRYCVDLGDEFGVSLEKALTIIDSSFKWWQKEFQSADLKGGVEIATQTFIPVNPDGKCSGESFGQASIRFQFGKLTPAQKKLVPVPDEFVGVAFRVGAYDRVNLRTKGFVYIAPAKGKDRPKSFEAYEAENPWNAGEGGLLQKVLVHELGHVFGIRDISGFLPSIYASTTAQPSYPGLMDPMFPQRVWDRAHEFFIPDTDLDSGIPLFFKQKQVGGQFRAEKFKPWGVVANDGDQIKVGQRLNNPLIYDLFLINSSSSTDSVQSHVGIINFDLTKKRMKEFLESPIRLFLPKEQEVFNLIGSAQGPQIVRTISSGYFHNFKNDKKYPATFEASPGEARIGAIIDNMWEFDFL